MQRITSLANGFLRLPLVWGSLATLAFYAAIRVGWLSQAEVVRYSDSHPIEWASTELFFVGMAALALRLLDLMGQFGVLGRVALPAAAPGGVPASEAASLLAKLTELPAAVRRSHVVRRLRDALEYVRQTDSAEGLEEQLDRLASAGRDHLSDAYGTPRLVRAVLPIVGMLGTVVGITMAIAELSPDKLEQSLGAVTGALGVAFDTTAQAMVLMLILWFTMFGVESFEQRLLDGVDQEAQRQLVGRFQTYGTATDPNVAAVRRMGEQVVSAVEQVAARQAETWQTAIDATHTRWASATATAGDLLVETLRTGLRESLRDHAVGLAEGAERQVGRLADTLADSVDVVHRSVRDQLTKLAEAEARHAERVEAAARSHVDRLATGSQEMLGSLRDGLERMAELLVEALQNHGASLAAAEEGLASENRRHLSEVEAALGEAMVVAADRQEKLIRQSESMLREMQEALVAAAGATVEHQKQLVKQGEVLLRVVETSGQITRLEDSLSRNLATLGRAHNFEETLLSLSAAIQLLSARVGRAEPHAPRVAGPTSQAA